MVIFQPAYYHPMDREYGHAEIADPSTNDVGVGIKDIGQSVVMGISPGPGAHTVATKIKHGASAIEIQFPGVGSGRRGAETPGLFGKEQRQAMKELAEINEVNLTTHASFSVMGLAGLGQEGFSEEQRKAMVDEIKRAINFAADVAKGGSVVVHSGEFPRPISEQPWAKDEKGNFIFKQHGKEEEEAVLRLVDKVTGRIIHQVRKNDVFFIPEKDEKGEPIWDEQKKEFKIRKITWQDIEKIAKEQNEDPRKVALKLILEGEEATYRGWAKYHTQDYDESQKILRELEKLKKKYEKIIKETPPEERWKLAIDARKNIQHIAPGITLPPEYKLPDEIINKAIEDIKYRLYHQKEAAIGYLKQAENAKKIMDNAVPIEDYAIKKSAQSYAEAAIHAMKLTEERKLEKPLFIAIENIFPEQFGGHPQELKQLIKESRERMKEILVKQYHMDEETAKKKAEQHIKATLDTGHINMWRKYWQDDPNLSIEENDKRFKEWVLKQVEDLAKNKMIGNVHLADNYGYHDDHLAPGQGTSPVKEIVRILKKYGYEGALTVEPGADATVDLSDFHGLMKTWRYFGSPIYALTRPTVPQRWGDVWYGYFGQTAPPYYIFGAYAPSNEWTLWSQVPLE